MTEKLSRTGGSRFEFSVLVIRACFGFRISIFVLVVLLVLGASAFLSCAPASRSEPTNVEAAVAAGETSAATGGPPPLIVDTETPLLLDEPADAENAATQAAAGNAACFVCHANYTTESLAGLHAGASVGCVNCHGASTAHRSDENNTTPPEIMYSAQTIDPFCQGCHKAHGIPPRTILARWLKRSENESNPSCTGTGCHKEDDVPPAKVVARWKEKGLDQTKTDPGAIVCTDCHGDHRMSIRTVIWDKASGKLLRTNKGG